MNRYCKLTKITSKGDSKIAPSLDHISANSQSKAEVVTDQLQQENLKKNK